MLTLAPHGDGSFGWDKLVHDRWRTDLDSGSPTARAAVEPIWMSALRCNQRHAAFRRILLNPLLRSLAMWLGGIFAIIAAPAARSTMLSW